MLVVGEHGLLGQARSDIDLSYLSDAVVVFRYFEARGEVRTAITALKSRTSAHEHSIREFRMRDGRGLQVGGALKNFEGVMTGLARYDGSTPLLGDEDRS